MSLVLPRNRIYVKWFKLRNFNIGTTTRGMIRVGETKSRQMRGDAIARDNQLQTPTAIHKAERTQRGKSVERARDD